MGEREKSNTQRALAFHLLGTMGSLGAHSLTDKIVSTSNKKRTTKLI